MRNAVPVLLALVLSACAGVGAPVAVADDLPRWLTLPEPPPMPPPEAAITIPAAHGARLYAAVYNRDGGSPVLLLHGGFASSDAWAAEVSRLAPTHQVIVMDSRGHGRSTLGDAPLSYRLLAGDALEVLDAFGAKRATVVGWSDGGVAGLLLAIEHPERIDGLLTYGTNFDRSGYLGELPDPRFAAVGKAYLARQEAAYRHVSPTPRGFPRLRAALEDLYAREPAITPAQLRTIRVPVMVVAGEHEQFIAPGHTARLASAIPEARRVIMPGVSHGGPLQDPDGFHDVLAGFLIARDPGDPLRLIHKP